MFYNHFAKSKLHLLKNTLHYTHKLFFYTFATHTTERLTMLNRI